MRSFLAIILLFITFIPNALGDNIITGNGQSWGNKTIKGDVNGDEKVDITDIVILVKILKTEDKQDASISDYNGDVNADGSIDLQDLDELKKIIFDIK